MYSQKGAGKGNSAMPSSHISSWVRNMGGLAKPHDILLGAHYHIIDARIADNKFCGILGATAGESGFEYARQYGGSQAYQSILTINPDGRIVFEIISERKLMETPIKDKKIAAIGVDSFIDEAFKQPVYLMPGASEKAMKPLYKRGLKLIPTAKLEFD
jgi:hypothetical protein